MKKYIFIVLNLWCFTAYSQDMSSVNSGANSSENLIYSVGEIFVVPISDADEANSGMIGAVSTMGFFVVGIHEFENPNKILVYPNPTANSIFLETGDNVVNEITIYDMNGRLISTRNVTAMQVDVTDLPTGNYIVKTDNPNIQSFNIIKK